MARAATKRLEVKEGEMRRQPRLSLRDQAYQVIKSKIVSCELKPGEAVTVTDLADALGIGRTPVIQAVDRLMIDGLVEVMPRKGVVVSPVSLDELVELIEVRQINEARVTRWAAERIQEKQLRELRDNLDRMLKATHARELDQLIELDRGFHRTIATSAGNSIMTELLGNLHDRAVRFWTLSLNVPDQNNRVCDQHAEIIEKLAAHDPAGAEKSMLDHINAFKANLFNTLMKN